MKTIVQHPDPVQVLTVIIDLSEDPQECRWDPIADYNGLQQLLFGILSMGLSLLDPNRHYTFRSYFEMVHEPDEILAEFGYGLIKTELSLPRIDPDQMPDNLEGLQDKLKRTMVRVNLTNETARRESLVFPILYEIAEICDAQIRIEYALEVNQWLKGNLDYLLRSQQNLIVIEAKKDDLVRGFLQMAVELIALSKVNDQEVIYGAVTTGDIWRFGQLQRDQQVIYQDLALYRIPADLRDLVSILVAILRGQWIESELDP